MAGTLTGGKRDRMLLESIFRGIETELAANGWFDVGRQHADITMIDEYPDEEGEVILNTLAVSMGETFGQSMELGSKATERTVPIFCDFFAESDALGRHVIGDILAWVETNPSIPVYDYDQATPAVDFYVQYDEETAETRKPARAINPWQKHWHVCEFRVRDERTNG